MTTGNKLNLNQSTIVQGAILAWVAVFIYASANSIVLSIVEIGAGHLIEGRNAITFCNLLFLGSLFSLVPMLFFFWKEWTRENLKKISKGDWVAMTISAVLSSALTPSLFFFALEFSNVTNVVLIGRLEPPVMLILSTLILKTVFDKWAFSGALIALIGAVIIITMRGEGSDFVFGKGEFAALAGIVSFMTSNLITKKKLTDVSFGVFSIYRTILGTIIYFFWALYLFGPHHFEDVFAPIVLKWTLVYAIIVIIGGQFAWNLALKKARTGDMTLATSFTPVASITIAMILLGEDPGDGIYLGGAVIISGILIALLGRMRKAKIEKKLEEEKLARENAMEHETEFHFKGA